MFKIDEYIKLDLLQIRYHIKGLCWYYSPEAKLLILSFNILSNADRRYQFWYFYLSFYLISIHVMCYIICRCPDYIGDPNYDCLVQAWLQYFRKNKLEPYWYIKRLHIIRNILKHLWSLLLRNIHIFFSYSSSTAPLNRDCNKRIFVMAKILQQLLFSTHSPSYHFWLCQNFYDHDGK